MAIVDINGKAISSLSHINGITKSSLSSVNGQTLPSGSDPGGSVITYGANGGAGTFTEITSGHWGSGPASFAVSGTSLAAGSNGIYYMKYLGSTNQNSIIGFAGTNTNNDYTVWEMPVLVYSVTGFYSYYASGVQTAGAGTTPSVGDFYGVRRSGAPGAAVYTFEYYRGGSWTVLYTFTAYNGVNVIVYLKGDIEGNPGYIDNPKLL